MPTTQEILNKAQDLGKLLAKHDALTRLESVLKTFQEDVEAQRLFNDYQRHLAKIGQKEAEGQQKVTLFVDLQRLSLSICKRRQFSLSLSVSLSARTNLTSPYLTSQTKDHKKRFHVLGTSHLIVCLSV